MPEREESFLLGVDVEDVRTMVENGESYSERVPANMERFFDFFDRHGARTTFFFVGGLLAMSPLLCSSSLTETISNPSYRSSSEAYLVSSNTLTVFPVTASMAETGWLNPSVT